MTGVVSNETNEDVHMYIEEFILDDLHYLMYKMELRILCRNYTGIYTITTRDEKCENCSWEPIDK